MSAKKTKTPTQFIGIDRSRGTDETCFAFTERHPDGSLLLLGIGRTLLEACKDAARNLEKAK